MGGLMQLVAYGAQDAYSYSDQGYNNVLNNNLNTFNISTSTTRTETRTVSTEIIKRLLEGNEECPVTYEKIKCGDKYTYCIQCNNNFSAEVFSWLHEHKSCPMCRNAWNNVIVYKNGDIVNETCRKHKYKKKITVKKYRKNTSLTKIKQAKDYYKHLKYLAKIKNIKYKHQYKKMFFKYNL